jgi:hypothetical protein
MLAGEHFQSVAPAIGSPIEFTMSGETLRRTAARIAPAAYADAAAADSGGQR